VRTKRHLLAACHFSGAPLSPQPSWPGLSRPSTRRCPNGPIGDILRQQLAVARMVTGGSNTWMSGTSPARRFRFAAGRHPVYSEPRTKKAARRRPSGVRIERVRVGMAGCIGTIGSDLIQQIDAHRGRCRGRRSADCIIRSRRHAGRRQPKRGVGGEPEALRQELHRDRQLLLKLGGLGNVV
jgi:hypothetical protein